MRMQKNLLSLAVASSLCAMSYSASAADLKPTLYGDLALALTYTTKSTNGGNDSYALNDNVSLVGVKGDAAVIGDTKFVYDYNAILDMTKGGSNPGTHLGYIGLDGPYGTLTAGHDNGLYNQMVDGTIYQTNWFYTPGMSALQVNKAVKYVSPSLNGLQVGGQVFDIGKDSTTGKATNNYTAAVSYSISGVTLGAGYTGYSDYSDNGKFAASSDQNQFGEATNTYAGLVLKSKAGVSVGYSQGKFGVVLADTVFKPADSGTQSTKDINTAMLTGSYAVTDKVGLVANVSTTSQSSDPTYGQKKGTVVTLMTSYAPADNLFFSFEVQNSDKKANESSLTGSTSGGGTKSSTSLALAGTYSF